MYNVKYTGISAYQNGNGTHPTLWKIFELVKMFPFFCKPRDGRYHNVHCSDLKAMQIVRMALDVKAAFYEIL